MTQKSVAKPNDTYPNILPDLEIRDNYRITEVARYLGLSNTAYYDIRTGRRQPSFMTIQKIEKLFDVSIQSIYTDWGNVSLEYIKKV